MDEDTRFDLTGITFNRLIIDDSIAIEFMDTCSSQSIKTEGSFVVRENAEPDFAFEIVRMINVDRLLKLLDKPLSHCIASGNGDLSVVFLDGTVLFVEHDPCYETWHLYLERYTVHSIGGDSYAVFRKDRK